MRNLRLATIVATSALALAAAVTSPPAEARDADRHTFHLAAQPLATALRTISTVSGRAIVAPADLVAGKTALALDGEYSAIDAASAVLAGLGLRVRQVANGLIIEADDSSARSDPSGTDIVVTGSRIRGAKSPSPVTEIGREAMKDAGRTSVADVIRTIPQNFGGGQNPGIGFNVPEASGADLGGGSTINLRGLGSDATLTLLDGHRLAYNAVTQSIDISAIPFGAIDRIEVVPDGASTIYGSDAVAGVVNVILRRNFSGLETTAKLSGSTDGGNFDQQYGLVGGVNWAFGNAFVAYEFNRNTPIVSGQRDYTATVRPGLTLYPKLQRHNVAVRARQDISPSLTFSIDGLFNARSTSVFFPLNAAGDLSVSSANTFSQTRAFSVAPSLELKLPANWRVSLAGSYGSNKVDYGGNYLFGATKLSAGAGYYWNRGTSVELSADGNLISLPGGSAKLALGGGYRRNDFVRFAGAGSASNIDRSQQSYYGFGELNAPVTRQIVASAAVRYESYTDIGSVATPKLGLVFSPIPDVDLKGSWGKSVRAPTLYQQFQPRTAYLALATSYGGGAYPAGSTVLYEIGGNAGLVPERSTNWSATVDLHPRAMRGFDFQVTYFSIDYTDRIVTPILFPSTSLSNSVYASYVTLAPTAAAQAALVADAATFTNLSGLPVYDPTRVVGIIRNTSVNAGSQQIRGVDGRIAYTASAGANIFRGFVNASYLTSKQQITAAQPVTPLAGILFNPPKLRGQAELSWRRGGLGITGDVNFIGPVRDTRIAGRSTRIAGMTPVDLTVRYQSPAARGLLSGLDIILSAQNIFNEAPSPIATTSYIDTPYDSTNYSAFGRVVSLSVSKKW